MASSTKIDVDYDYDYEVDQKDGGMDTLDFQDIPHSSGDTEKGKTHQFTNFPHSAVDSDEEGEEDTSKLLQDEPKSTPSSSSFWTFNYYQQFFNVDTRQVGMRIIGSMLPKPGRNYLVKEIRPNPDLYGPFWICTTLVFTTAIAGNLANYFSSAGDYHWKYDFHKVTFAATAIFGYWWLIPLLLFGVIWWQGYRDRFSFLEMICVYGYSLAIYIPISVLWAIQVAWLQWILVVLGAVLSGSVLLMTFWPVVSEGNKKIAIGVMVFIFVMHAALAAGFVLYFFYVPATSANHSSTLAPNPVTLAPSAKVNSPLENNKQISSQQNDQNADSKKIVNKSDISPNIGDVIPAKDKPQSTLIRKLIPKGLEDKNKVISPLSSYTNNESVEPNSNKQRSVPQNTNNIGGKDSVQSNLNKQKSVPQTTKDTDSDSVKPNKQKPTAQNINKTSEIENQQKLLKQ